MIVGEKCGDESIGGVGECADQLSCPCRDSGLAPSLDFIRTN